MKLFYLGASVVEALAVRSTFENDLWAGSSGDVGRLLKMRDDLLAQPFTLSLTLALRCVLWLQGNSRHCSVGDCSGNDGVRMELPGEQRRIESSRLGRSWEGEYGPVATVPREAFMMASEKGASKSSRNRGLRGPG